MLTPHVFDNQEQMSQFAADWLLRRIAAVPHALLCVASGATPTRTYQQFTQAILTQSLARQFRVIKLDEWGGIPLDHPATCESHLRRVLIDPLALDSHYTAFDSDPDDPQRECDNMSHWLRQQGPIDTCILGLGLNGHLGFNEPASALQPHAHVAQLSPTSLAHPMLSAADPLSADVQSQASPSYGLTLGMADLLQAEHILLLVAGSAKRASLRELLQGTIRTEFPASFLALHPRVQVLCDRQAWPG